MHKKKRFEESTIESWPDVLKDIRIESIPTDYIEHIKINFIDGREWIIDVSDNPDADYNAAIEELYQEYSNSIKTINFNELHSKYFFYILILYNLCIYF